MPRTSLFSLCRSRWRTSPLRMTLNDDSQRENDTNSQISISRGSSIHGPYRQAKLDNTFPRSHLVHSITGAEETYSRSLLSSGNGFAFWDITGSHVRGSSRIEQPDAVPLQGMSIGDVGMIDPHGHVPEEFEELHPSLDRESEVQVTPDYFEPGSIVASKGVHINRISEEPLKLSFWSTAREGALLVLPQGGSREDLISTSRLSEYVNKHALNWYQYMCQHARSTATTVPNGSLYLITGCDRAKSWSALAFPSKWRDAGKRIEMAYEGEDFPAWLPSRWAREKTVGLVEGKDRNFCVFARGIHISLSNQLWVRHLPYHPPDESPYYNILSAPVLGFRSRIARIRERFMRDSDDILDGHQKFPFHPSVLISQILLEKVILRPDACVLLLKGRQHPGADIVLVEDSVWFNLAKGGHGTLSEILDLVVTAIMSCELVTVDKLVSLVPKASEFPPPQKLGFLRNLFAKYAGWRARSKVLSQAQKILRTT